MNKQIQKLTTVIIICASAIALCFTGCKTHVNNEQLEESNVVYIQLGEQKRADNLVNSNRTASVIKPAFVDYTVTAYEVDAAGKRKPERPKTEDDCGNPVIVTEPFNNMELTYKLALSTGYWIFDVKGYEGHEKTTNTTDDTNETDDTNTTDDTTGSNDTGNTANTETTTNANNTTERTNVILFGNTTGDPVYCNGGRYYKTVYVYFTTNEKGNVNLDIDVSKVTINRLKISGTNIALDGDNYLRDNDKNIIKINPEQKLPSGTYTAKMDFYYNSVLLYTTTEIINITDNLTVENWIYSGGSDHLVKKQPLETNTTDEETNKIYTADFVLTPELIIQNKNTYCYVQGSSVSNPVGITNVDSPSDSNSGSIVSPYSTIQTAFDRVMALNTEFINAGKPEQSFTIYINGTVNTSSQTNNSGKREPAEIFNAADNSFSLILARDGTSATNEINGDIIIGNNIPTTITNLSIDGLNTSSKLTMDNCTVSGESPFEINDVSSEQSTITDTKIGSETDGVRTNNLISFKNSNVTISNDKDSSIYSTDFIVDSSYIDISCNSSGSDQIQLRTDNFILRNLNGSNQNVININSAKINASESFSIENSNFINFANIDISSVDFMATNSQNISLNHCNVSPSNKSTINDSQIVFAETPLSGSLSINGNTSQTSSALYKGESAGRKLTFTGQTTKISGLSMEVKNAEVEFINNCSVTTSNSIIITGSKLAFDSSTLNASNLNLSIDRSQTTINNSKIKARTLKLGTEAQNSTNKTDAFTINKSNDIQITTSTLNNSTISFNDSKLTGNLLMANDDFTFKNTTISGDIGKASSGSGTTATPGKGIDTASKVILEGTSVVSGNIYLEDKSILYVKSLPEKTSNSGTIATLSALYPTKGEVVLICLNTKDEEIDFDNTFIVDEAQTESEIDNRFKLSSPGYYLDYAVPEEDTIRKGIIRESSIGIQLPVTGGYTIDIETNDNVKFNEQGYIEINKNVLEQAPIKAIIKDRNGNILKDANGNDIPVTYQLYRGSTKIGEAVTSSANIQGITVSGDNLEQEMQHTDKLTYLLRITFTDLTTNLTYSDIFFVNIIK